jgi:DNA-directed RNA polymerase specialized sigma24 family protein
VIRAIYGNGQRGTDVARMLGQPLRSFRRRLRRIVKRVLAPEFPFVLRHRSRWPKVRRAVATAIFVEGRSARRAAAELGLSQHAVRRHVDVVRALHESSAFAQGGEAEAAA